MSAVAGSILDLRRTIIELALDFAELPVGARFGGLRGGTARITKTGAVLSHFAYVPGVTLTGLLPTGIVLKNKGASANLTVGGSAAAAGHLRVASGGRISGSLAGQHFHTNLSTQVKLARTGSQAAEGLGAAASYALPLPALARIP